MEMEPQAEDNVDAPLCGAALKLYEASCVGQTASRQQTYESAVKAFLRFLTYAHGAGLGLPLLIADVTEAQWTSNTLYLQFLKWLEEKASWGLSKKSYAPRTIAGYFRALLNIAHRSLMDGYKKGGKALPERVEKFFSVLTESKRNTWLTISEFNLERRINEDAMESGAPPTGLQGDDDEELLFADMRRIVTMYHREGSADSLLRAALLLDEFQTVSRSGEPIGSPWFLLEWNPTLKNVQGKRYQPKTGKLKKIVWLPAAPTDEAGAPADIYLAQAQLAATGYWSTTVFKGSQPVLYPSKFNLAQSTVNLYMTSIVCVQCARFSSCTFKPT